MQRVLSLVLLVGFFGIISQQTTDAIIIDKVERELDLTGPFARIEERLIISNSAEKPADEVLYEISPSYPGTVAFIEVSAKLGDKRQPLATESSGKSSWRIKLHQPIGANEHLNIIIRYVLIQCVRPYPAEIKQGDSQMVVFTGNMHVYSPYVIKSESVKVIAASPQFESYTKMKPFNVQDNMITYGPFENLSPKSAANLDVHFTNNKPYLVVTSMTRIVDLSLWGSNVAIEEHYEIRHVGAKLKGPFSRYDYQIHNDGVSSVKSFTTILPAAARDIYYRDEIGNISTSNVRETFESVEMEIRPRFPLFGGWKTQYYIGYNVPAHEFLYKGPNGYILKMPIIDHIFDEQLVEDFTLKVILPEGASSIKFTAPFPVQRRSDEVQHVYLDFTDTLVRPIVIVKSQNLVDGHIQNFELQFSVSAFYYLHQPLLFIAAFATIFATVIGCVRLDFSITKDENAEAKMRVSSYTETVFRNFGRIRTSYTELETALSALKTTKDQTSFNNDKKRIDGDHKVALEALTKAATKLKSDNQTEWAERVNELVRFDAKVRDQLAGQAVNVERFIGQKITKQAFVDSDDAARGQIRDIVGRMEQVAAVFA